MLLPLNAPRIPLPPAPAQATLPLPQYGQRLLALYAGVLLLLGGPIAAQTFEPLEQVGQLMMVQQAWQHPRSEAAACCSDLLQ